MNTVRAERSKNQEIAEKERNARIENGESGNETRRINGSANEKIERDEIPRKTDRKGE